MVEKNLVDRLNKRIKIQSKVKMADGFGGYSEIWSDLKTLWAEIKPISNAENFEANQIGEKTSFIITIRYFDLLTTQQRIKYGERIFNIVGVINPLENNQIIEIAAEEML
ncbi:MAG: phage head closure protein [Rickettsiales bacterium]|nr:phage head closure protein [Rickettsiales bacterium]